MRSLGQVLQISIVVPTDLKLGYDLTNPSATYENPKLIAVWGTITTTTTTIIIIISITTTTTTTATTI